MIAKASVELRRKLGESLRSIQRFDKPLEATSTSLEALHAYTIARKARQEGRRGDQMALLKRAVELDPNFARAYSDLAAESVNLKQSDQAYAYGRKAFELRDRVTEAEKFSLLDRYYGLVTGQLDERIQSAKLWTLTYPRDSLAFAALSTAYGKAGQNEKALDAALEALRLNPDGVTSTWVNAMGYYATLGRLDDAKRIYDEAVRRKISYSHLPVYYFDIAFLRRDNAAMQAAVQQAMRREGGDYEILLEQGCAEAYFGRIRNAAAYLDRAIAAAKRDASRAALAYATRAHIEALVGLRAAARRDANAALQHARDREVLALAGWSLALTNDSAAAKAVAADLQAANPLNTIVNETYLPVMRAEMLSPTAESKQQSKPLQRPYLTSLPRTAPR